MFLKSLVLRGFKSFAERTALTFQPGISVVVGPNGSGKSNVVDAIVWVLGEQGPATLRGGRMEDVIFAGSGTRPALGMAEVTLTIDNSAGLLPVEFNEVTISRILFRSGDSEYRLNGSTCRLLDIQELLSDAGVGREQHIIVGQGRLDEVLSADPQQMRTIIEEAAGVGKHRRRRDRALRKIAAAEGNLVHLGDLLAEIRRQLRPLRQQAELAEKHDQLSDSLRGVRMILDARQLAEIAALLGPPDDDLEVRVAGLQSEVFVLDEKLSGLEQERGNLQNLAAQRRELQWRFSAGSEKLRSLKRLADEKARTLAAELAATGEAVGEAQITELTRQLDEARQARRRAAEAQSEQERAVALAVTAMNSGREKCAAADSVLTAERESNAALTAGLVRLNAESDSVESSRRAAEIEQRRLVDRMQRDVECKDVLEGRLARLDEVLGTLSMRRETLTKVSARAQERMDRLQASRSRLQDRIRDLEQEAAVVRARAEARSSTASSGAARRAVSRAREGAAALSDLVDLSKERRQALEALLGPLEGVVVVSDRIAAGEVLQGQASDAVTLLVADGSGNPVAGAEPLLLQVEVADARAAAALGNVYLAPSPDEAIRLAGMHRHAIFVTSEGTVATAGMVWRASTDVAVSARKLAQSSEGLRAELTEVDGKIAELRAEMERHRGESNRLDGEVAQASQQTRMDELEARALSAHIAEAESGISQAEESVASLSRKSELLRTTVAEAQRRKDTSDAEVSRLVQEHASAAREMAEASAACDSARMVSGKLSERVRMHDERIEGLADRISQANRLLRGIDHERAALEAARMKTESLGALSERLSEGVGAWASNAGEAHSKTLESLRQVESQISEIRAVRAEAVARLEDVRVRAKQEDLARSELKVRRRILEASVREQWGIEPEDLVDGFALQRPSPEEGPADGSIEHLASLDEVGLEARKLRLQRQLTAMGNVNPLAAREARSLGEREAFLASQIEDVRSSRRDLLKVVDAVDEKIRDLFASAFADIAAQFERLFGMLFPQGKGKLRLTDPHDILTSGVEVEAGPTGRNLKRLSLLSGGERALSALAVLFAIFRARPSPFYILDEVEAALDDVNLHRFLELLIQFRDSSQLLVVTHQKRTMEIADVLYGVAMRPDGVSKVISERLTELFSA